METFSGYVLTFLLNALWQVMIVAMIAAGCARLLRKTPVRFQHVLWVLALVISVSLPLQSLLQKPEIRGGFNSSFRSQSASGQAKTNSKIAYSGDEFSTKIFEEEKTNFDLFVSTLSFPIVAFYSIYLFLCLFRFGRAARETGRIRRAAYRRELKPPIKAAVFSCEKAFEASDVRILCSPYISAPITAGFFRPVIILPESLFDVTSAEMLAAAIGHETAHVKRGDYALNLVYELLYLLISFHPAARFIKRRINETREMACDEAVAARLLSDGAYARSLINLAALLSKPQHQSAFVMSIMNDDILETRIKRLICNERRINNRGGRLLLTVTAFLLAACCGIASVFSFNFIRDDGYKKTVRSANGVSGTWRGEWQGLPGATLIIKSTTDQPGGTIAFYPLKKTSSGLKVAGSTGELPLIKPKLDGDSLSFKIKRPLSDDIIEAEVDFISENEAVLKLESDEIKGGKNETRMRRDVAR